MTDSGIRPIAVDLYGDVGPPASLGLRNYWPGLAITALAVLAAAFLAEHYGVPQTLMGLLVGLSLNFLGTDERLQPGLGVAASGFLKLGIIMTGARVTLLQIAELGPLACSSLVLLVAAVIATGMGLSKLARMGTSFGALVGASVAICGASAAMAVAAVLGERRASRAELMLVLVGISVMSALAMSTYPIFARELALSDRQAGFFLGASIHDVAQSLGAGYAFSERAGPIATVVKLARVALLGPVLMLAGFIQARHGGPGRGIPGLPWFVPGFLVVVWINSSGIAPPTVMNGLGSMSTVLVVASVVAAAVRSPISQVVGHGVRPLMVILCTTLASALISLLVAEVVL